MLQSAREAAREHGGLYWGDVLNGDTCITDADIACYLDIAQRIARVSNDDKTKVPTGEPGGPIGANVRAMAAALAVKAVRLLSMDHSWHRASITPTVTLQSDLAHAFQSGKYRNGQVTICLKESVLQPSSAFRNASELSTTILAACPKPIICQQAH